MTSYRSIAQPLRVEPEKVKGSRHIASLAPIEGEADVAALLDEVRAEFPSANHHAYAWRLGRRGESFYYSDDGEPSGSAGKPIMQHLEGRELTHVVCVVTRIFGGTKLGVGGLVRAYSGAAAAALDAAEIVVVTPKVRIRARYPYSCSSAMQALLHAWDVEVVSADYGAEVDQRFEIVETEAEGFERSIVDATAGAAVVERVAD